MLKGMQGISYAEALAERDGDAYTYLIESEYGVDIRKKLFYQLAERAWPMIGMEALGMSLEDIFITVVDKSEESKLNTGVQGRIKRRSRAQEKSAIEREVGASLYEEAQRQRSAASLDESTDDEDDE
jgi:hypothetical protein